jgi:glycosyltransferase involved in cell wall biosynthesis
MAHGKPVIGGAHGGVLDVVEDGVTGWLVPHGDVDRLSAALEWLFADPVRAREMGERGRQRLITTFSFKQFHSRLTQVLNDALVR